MIPVAILTSDEFDATGVDHNTVAFGPNGATETHSNKLGVTRHQEDVDGDGDIDLVLHFRFGETGIACGDVEAELNGETFDGQAISGSDTIRTVAAGTGPQPPSATGIWSGNMFTPPPANASRSISLTLQETNFDVTGFGRNREPEWHSVLFFYRDRQPYAPGNYAHSQLTRICSGECDGQPHGWAPQLRRP